VKHPDPDRGRGATHAVENQPPPLEDVNWFELDAALGEGIEREGGNWAAERVRAYGQVMGRAETLALGRDANRHPPELTAFDRFGHRIDEVAFHPAWHALMALAMEHEVHALPWREPRPGAHVARTALHAILCQVEAGHACPITMTYACVPTLRAEPAVADEWEPRVLGTRYDPRSRPAREKTAATIGMGMTEKQGGSDVRANSTLAHPIGGDAYELVGHKWFYSAPMSDALLTLALTRPGAPPTCFLVPRWRPDGSRNPFHIQRLKDKLGNRSNASSEIEYRGTWARRVGPEQRGVRTILAMVHHTRLDCVSGSTGLMRMALAQALHHTRHRAAFGRRLADQPLMRNVLADLALEVEAATALMLRLARGYDRAEGDAGERAFARITAAVGKYWVCKRAPHAIGGAMECLGGNGYVEEAILARLYREAPLNAIWEGSGNVICLDVLRAIAREPDALPALLGEIRLALGADARLDAALAQLEQDLRDPADAETRARSIVERLAIALQASLLVRHAPAPVADAFCASRLAGGGRMFGTLPASTDFAAILARALPV
jgi:putative acyl-CoA dehydrogenase